MPFPTTSVLNSSASPVTVNTLPNAGQNTKAETLGVNLASDDDLFPKIGPVTETAPASDTASSGLNGRLQRVAQRLTALIALLPASLGTKTAAASLAVTLASDGAMPVAIGTAADAVVANGVGGTLAGYLRTIKDAATDTTTESPVKVLTYTANSKYKALPASSSAAVIGATGATGDYLSHVLIIPATTSPGAVSITDGSGSAITIFTGGASSVTNLVPFVVPVGAVSTTGAWKATTGTNVSIIGFGSLT